MLNISRTLKARPDLWAILSFYAGILRLFHTLWKLGELFRASNYLRPSEHSGQMISYLVVRKPRHYHLSGISAGSDCCFGVFNQPRPEKLGANLLHNLISLPEIPKSQRSRLLPSFPGTPRLSSAGDTCTSVYFLTNSSFQGI